ncbi:oligosaccharide flippase family protein [Aurantiacibacter sp. MUD11]|uniref:lipopolysaccharide biosynthesis protein n=1 Tax=Aurantiacibacter sp. MUD11 TaxID=3003265 RepID=UPI0022A9FFAD|nr:oligosaccharide flippase family protein [Aurantiacibacter sp. MUD11]WAT17033.1 oligosaccharide flippase family protein [Aurantiacibacter sp. MUD11]
MAGKFHFDLFVGLLLRGLGAIASFALTWLIARTFGPTGVGLYHIGLSTALFFGTIASLGMDFVLIRKMGALLKDGLWDDLKATFQRCERYIIAVGLPLALLLIGASHAISHYVFRERDAAVFLLIFAIIAVLAPILKLGNALLRAAGRVVQSQFLEGFAYSTLTCLIIVTALYISDNVVLQLPAIAYVSSVVIVLIINRLLVHRMLKRAKKNGEATVRIWEGWRIAALQTATSLGTWGSLALVAALLDVATAGIFRTAFQLCLVLQTISSAFGTMAAPHLARAAAENDMKDLIRKVLIAGLNGVGLAIPLWIIGMGFAEEILFFFDPSFIEGSGALRIMIVAFTVEIAFGLSGMALVMMHREAFVLRHEIAANLAGLLLIALLIPSMGIMGAALGLLSISVIRCGANVVTMLVVTQKNAQKALSCDG